MNMLAAGKKQPNKTIIMKRIAMLGSGFIGRFYADALQGYRSKDKVVSIYSRREESAKKFAQDYNCEHWTTNMEESIAHPNVDVVCISLPNNLHEPAVMLCCKHRSEERRVGKECRSRWSQCQ